MNRAIIFICLFFAASAANSFAQSSSKSVECKLAPDQKFNYRIVQQGRSIGETPIFHLRVVIKKNERYNRTAMPKFAENIKARFCNEQTIGVAIFDDAATADEMKVVTDYLVDQKKSPGLRGFYSLDRKTGRESIQFWTSRENSAEAVMIELSKANKQ